LLENKYANFKPRSTAKTSTLNILTVSRACISPPLSFGSGKIAILKVVTRLFGFASTVDFLLDYSLSVYSEEP